MEEPMKQQSMSVSYGSPGGKAHNVEYEYRTGLANVNPERTRANEVLVNRDLVEVYEKLFGNAVLEHNEKVAASHPERAYGSGSPKGTYLDSIRAGKREKASYELVAQIGNMDTNPADEPSCRLVSAEVYKRFLELFQERFPHFEIATAAIHVDEATPHIHVEYVPWTDAPTKRGLSVRNSHRGAMKLDGCASNEELNSELFALLEQAAQEHGIERVAMGCTEAHVPVRIFKERVRLGEDYPYRNDPEVLKLIQEQQQIIEQQQELLGKVESMPLRLGGIRRALLDLRALISGSGLREAVASVREKVECIPDLWRDFVINPVSDKMRKAREEWPAKEQERARRADEESRLDAIIAGAMEPVGQEERPGGERGWDAR